MPAILRLASFQEFRRFGFRNRDRVQGLPDLGLEPHRPRRVTIRIPPAMKASDSGMLEGIVRFCRWWVRGFRANMGQLSVYWTASMPG